MEIIKPSILPGFMELLPNEQRKFNKIKDIVRQTFEANAFENIETPIIEKTEILLAKGGGETTKQIYNIDHESRNMSLRFDLTVPLSRYVSEHFHNIEFPFRRYHIGKVYRGERNQKGRYKEFYQCDIDIIGSNSLDIRNDAEVPAIMYQVFKNLKIDNAKINVNNRKLLNGFLNELGLDNYIEILRVIDKIDKVDKEKFRLMLSEEIKNEIKLDKVINFISHKNGNHETLTFLNSLEIEDELFREGLNEINEVYKYMKLFGVSEEAIVINLSITRGLDYYTGMVFETFLEGYESIGSICSGGRYDDLASNFTKQKLPGVGMSIGLTRLFYQLSEADLIKIDDEAYCDVLVVPMGNTYEPSMEILANLRNKGIKGQIYFENHKFKKIFNYADKQRIKYVIIAGEEEISQGKISLRNMQTGVQEAICLNEAINIIKK